MGEALEILNWEIWKFFPDPANENEYHERWFREVESIRDEDEDDYYATLLTIRFSERGKSFKIEWNPKMRKIRRGKNQPYCISAPGTPAEAIVRNIAVGTGWSMAETMLEIRQRIGLEKTPFEDWMLGWRCPHETFQRRLYFAQFARETMVKIPKTEEKLIAAARYVGLNVIVTE
ncbi:MAG: hypothetical protein LUE08_07060 [Akkermansiaceae bacterium]|nr:hypothetical protein [Akkermansiaceae bacterium]